MKSRAEALGFVAILAVLLGLLSAAPAAADLWRKEPYLIYPGTVTQMEVVWQLTATATPTIEWGTDDTYAVGSAQTAEYGIDHQHAYTITDLVPGTKYYYRVTVEGVVHQGTFAAAPPADAARLKFLVYGDTRTNTTIHDQVAGAMLSVCAADTEYQTFALVGGDLTASGNTESYWTNELFNPIYANIRQLMASLPYHSCMGNHEGTGVLFTKYFPYPFAAGRYWSFDYGPAHFAILDQYTDYLPGSAQYQWLVNDLENAKKPWKFVCLHEPGWSAGGGHVNNVTVQNYLEPVFETYMVPVVFGGHNHYYARAVVNGVQHVTTGGGGAPLYSPDLGYPKVVAGASAYHFCEIAIDAGTLAFKAVNLAGAVIDSFSMVRPVPVEEGLGAGASLSAARPNPFTGATVIEYRLAEGARGRLVIRDAAGRQVRTFPGLAPGRHVLTWDAKDDEGRPVRSGLYFYRLESPSGSEQGKLLLLR